MRPTKHRFSVGKFTSSASNAKPSGNWSSGRLKWQKPLRKNTSISVHIRSFNWKSESEKRWDSKDGFTQHSFSKTSEFYICILERIFQFIIQRLLFSLNQNRGASIQDSLGSSLHHQQVLRLWRIGILVDWELEKAYYGMLGRTVKSIDKVNFKVTFIAKYQKLHPVIKSMSFYQSVIPDIKCNTKKLKYQWNM